MKFVKLIEEIVDVIECIGSQWMATELRDLPGCQIPENTDQLLSHLGLQTLNFFIKVDRVVRANVTQLVNFRL